jgi:hypothetical protein
MFEGYPRYASSVYSPPPLTETTSELAEMPAIKGADDMRAMVTRLCLVQEDPRQLLSGCVTDHAAEQLRLNGNDPLAVVCRDWTASFIDRVLERLNFSLMKSIP